MFLGQYEHAIDDKGRLTIPARFRDLLISGAYITQGFDENLIVLTAPLFEKIYEQVNQMSMTNPSARLFRRLFFSHADWVVADKSGRILIPQFLRQAANLTHGAVIVGVGNHFEIWSPERWTEQDNLLSDSEANAQRFAALDLSV
jgi:MraZ protein